MKRRVACCIFGVTFMAVARDYYVAPTGDNNADGTTTKPLQTIQAASDRAQPGDMITVRAGVYRERINPPRGGTSDSARIVYQAVPGTVTIKGSECVKGWTKVEHDTWTVTLPNIFFGTFNPYADVIKGDWFKPLGRVHHTGAVYLNGHWLVEAAKVEEVLKPAGKQPVWFGKVEEGKTTLWAQLPGVDPNKEGIEINVRQSVFYPSKTNIDFITVNGFTLEHAATPWAPPTAEQIGAIGTHWSKGWVIENNTIRYSVCSGVTLGKHGDAFDNTSQNSAVGYVETIKRGLAAGWTREKIGHHVVRNNQISHCEQTGICGSLGCSFSTVTGNDIHDIHVRQLYSGAEMAGIKFHGAIDTLIAQNHVYRAGRGIWLDWMTQGTRVTGNLVYDIAPRECLFLEVNHGPFLVDHNIFISPIALLDVSQGGAYAHNIFDGKMIAKPEPGRDTPWQEEHGTAIAGLSATQGGDNHFMNNVFVGASSGLVGYDASARTNRMSGNVFLKGAKPSKHEMAPLVLDVDPGLALSQHKDGLKLALRASWSNGASNLLVTSELLGKTAVSLQAFVKPDGSPYRLDCDYFGTRHDAASPAAGPFATPPSTGRPAIKVWPR